MAEPRATAAGGNRPQGCQSRADDRAVGAGEVVPERVGKGTAPRRGDGATSSAARRSRYVPAAVRREVWQRDGARCTFIGVEGRCEERGMLEYHHLVPFAAGGEATAVNLVLACAAHNQYEAERFFRAP